jgi:hypothetical protein
MALWVSSVAYLNLRGGWHETHGDPGYVIWRRLLTILDSIICPALHPYITAFLAI